MGRKVIALANTWVFYLDCAESTESRPFLVGRHWLSPLLPKAVLTVWPRDYMDELEAAAAVEATAMAIDLDEDITSVELWLSELSELSELSDRLSDTVGQLSDTLSDTLSDNCRTTVGQLSDSTVGPLSDTVGHCRTLSDHCRTLSDTVGLVFCGRGCVRIGITVGITRATV